MHNSEEQLAGVETNNNLEALVLRLTDENAALMHSLDTARRDTKKEHEAALNRALGNAAAHREKLEKENHRLYGELVAERKKLDDLQERINRDAPLISVLEQHVGSVRPNCVCPVCKIQRVTEEKIEAVNARLNDMKAKNAELKEALKGFLGPKSKKK